MRYVKSIILISVLAFHHVGCGEKADQATAATVAVSQPSRDVDTVIAQLKERIAPTEYVDNAELSIGQHLSVLARLKGLDLDYEPDVEFWENTLDFIDGKIRKSMYISYVSQKVIFYGSHAASYLREMSMERDGWASYYYLKGALTASSAGKKPELVEFDGAPKSAERYQFWYRLSVENNWDDIKKNHKMTAAVVGSLRDRTRHGPTLALIAFYYLSGRTPYQAVDPEQARLIMRRAAESDISDKDHPMVSYMNASIDIFYGDDASKKKAFQVLKRLTDEGFAHAQNLLGECYRFGVGTEKDLEKAIALYKRGVEVGHPRSCFIYGTLLYLGNGVPEDKKRAYELFKYSAEAHDPLALMAVASMYKAGDGVPQSRLDYMTYLLRAATAGNSSAMADIADILKETNQPERAAFWLGLKAEADASDETVEGFYQSLLTAESVSHQYILNQIPSLRVEVHNDCKGLDNLYWVGGIKEFVEQVLREKGIRVDNDSLYTYKLTIHGDITKPDRLRMALYSSRIIVPAVAINPDGELELFKSTLTYAYFMIPVSEDIWGRTYSSKSFQEDLRGAVLALFDYIGKGRENTEGDDAYRARIGALGAAITYAQYHAQKFLYSSQSEERTPRRFYLGTPFSAAHFQTLSTNFYDGAERDLKQAWQQGFTQGGGVLDVNALRNMSYIYMLTSKRVRGQWFTYMASIGNYCQNDAVVNIGDKFYRCSVSYDEHVHAQATTSSDADVMDVLKDSLRVRAQWIGEQAKAATSSR